MGNRFLNRNCIQALSLSGNPNFSLLLPNPGNRSQCLVQNTTKRVGLVQSGPYHHFIEKYRVIVISFVRVTWSYYYQEVLGISLFDIKNWKKYYYYISICNWSYILTILNVLATKRHQNPRTDYADSAIPKESNLIISYVIPSLKIYLRSIFHIFLMDWFKTYDQLQIDI
jgi:hypothetical protein